MISDINKCKCTIRSNLLKRGNDILFNYWLKLKFIVIIQEKKIAGLNIRDDAVCKKELNTKMHIQISD